METGIQGKNRKDDENKNKEKKYRHKKLRVFISYSRRHDKVIAGLLAHALKEQCFDVYYDRRLFAGLNIVKQISQYIADSHAVILLLSKNSVDSAWVNQEIGFARALNKPIIPIQVDSGELQPVGMLREINPLEFNITDWFNSAISIKHLASNIYETVDKKDNPPSVIKTKEKRTQKIIDEFNNLNKLLDNMKCNDKCQEVKFKLYKRTSVSIFSIEGPLKEQYDPKYWDLLRKQREVIENFIKHDAVEEVRLHLCPGERQYEKQRFQNLINFLKANKDNEKIKIKLEKHSQTNVIAVYNHFVFEGLRPRSENEYIYTLLWPYPSSMIKKYFSPSWLSNNDCNWKSLSDKYEEIIGHLESYCKDCKYICQECKKYGCNNKELRAQMGLGADGDGRRDGAHFKKGGKIFTKFHNRKNKKMF